MQLKVIVLAATAIAALPSAALAQSVIVKSAPTVIEQTDDTPSHVVVDIDQPRFHDYIIKEHRPSVVYERPVTVGTVLPESSIEYYDVPAEYGRSHAYKYTILNNRPVLVEPATRRVVEVLN